VACPQALIVFLEFGPDSAQFLGKRKASAITTILGAVCLSVEMNHAVLAQWALTWIKDKIGARQRPKMSELRGFCMFQQIMGIPFRNVLELHPAGVTTRS